MQLRFLPSFLLCAILGSQPVYAAGPADEAVRIEARQLTGKKNDQFEAHGEVELYRGQQKIRADHLIYKQKENSVNARGNVLLEQPDGTVSGSELQLNLESQVGDIHQPAFTFSENHARGTAATMHSSSKLKHQYIDASYTTCPAGNDDWLLRMGRLDIDRATQTGTALHARVEFKGIPFLYTPWMDFGLNADRRSGFLGPLFGSTNKGGTEITLPYYWNIAPNFDATFAPRLIGKRGTQLNNEFRYLEPSFGGEAHVDMLANDRLTQSTRSHIALKHGHRVTDSLALSMDLNRVSDDAYFRDLSSTVSGTAQTNLNRDIALAYSGPWWNATARVQRFQTLQDPLAPIVVPYRRQPQFNFAARRAFAAGNAALNSEFTDFRHDTLLSAQRFVFYPTFTYELWNESGYFLTPRIGLHHTRYNMGINNTGGLADATRTLPTFSLDSGLIMERDWASTLGGDYVQTLEPRLYYVNIPYRDQSQLPLFDTAQAPFNFAQIFTENRFFGNDRVGDANMATLALTSRIINNTTGAEHLRFILGQRFSFSTPLVTLNNLPSSTTNRSDVLLGIGGRISQTLNLDSLFQYNPNQSHTESYYIVSRYKPEAGKVLNLGYRYTRNVLRQADISAQWPLLGHWHGVGRINYSLQDRRILDALGGLEYNRECWSARFVLQSFATATQERSTGVFVQLELNDLMQIGSDPLSALRTSIYGYSKITPHTEASAASVAP